MKKKTMFLTMVLVISILPIFAKAKIVNEYGHKIIYSTSKLSEKDFEGSNFFLEDINNPYYVDLNIQLFNKLKSKINIGDAVFDSKSSEYLEKNVIKRKNGEAIVLNIEGVFNNTIRYYVYDKNKKGFVAYIFNYYGDEEEYKAYNENIIYYDKCVKGIEWCNWALENCANSTIRKSRTVSVPYTYQERVLVEAGSIGSRTKHMGSSGMTQDRYETVTRTAYRDEIEYYDAPNPNYNLDNVAKAKKDLPIWEKEKVTTKEKIKLPFLIYVWDGEDWKLIF